MSLLKFLGFGTSEPASTPGAAETQSVRKIVAELEALDPDRARYLASFAYVLGRVALADRVITAEETREMERVVAEAGGLVDDMAVLVVQIAKSQAQLFGGTEDYLVTREFGRLATFDQRIDLRRIAICACILEFHYDCVQNVNMLTKHNNLSYVGSDFLQDAERRVVPIHSGRKAADLIVQTDLGT